jgi:hypothetical protein
MKKTVLLIICLFLLASCSSVIYYPNGVNAPLLKEKDDIILSGAIKGMGIDLRSAYAMTDHFAVQFNANALNFESVELGREYRSGQYYAETAAGFYKPLSSALILEGFFGAGLGQSFSRNLDTDVLRSTDYFKIYLQLDAGFRWRFFHLGLAAKEAVVLAAAPRFDGIVAEAPKTDLFFEPFLLLGIGPEKFKFTAQAGLSVSHFSAIIYAPFIVSAGFQSKFSLK